MKESTAKKVKTELELPTAALLRHYAQTAKERYVAVLFYLLADRVEKYGRTWAPTYDEVSTELDKFEPALTMTQKGVRFGN